MACFCRCRKTQQASPMHLLVVVTNYPHAGHLSSGAFNERSVRTLQELGHRVEVLAPRPYVPRILAACHPRWRAYDQMVADETRRGVPVYRPAYVQLPGIGGVLRPDQGAYLSCARRLSKRHKAKPYDAILAFNLIGAGGLAWRLARRLAIPAAGWATGNDVRVPGNSAHGRALRLTLEALDLVFYQSTELLERAAALLAAGGVSLRGGDHVILARGIEAPPPMSQAVRARVRAKLGLQPEQTMVLYLGRMVAAKGIFELVDAIDLARVQQRDMVCVMVGAHAAFDDTAELRQRLQRSSALLRHLQLLPVCQPDKVWQYLNAADIFAFPSHGEGMPNSLLEAMACGLPCVACAIPPILDLDSGLGVLKTIRPRDPVELSSALLELARAPEQRGILGQKGKQRVLDNYLATANMAKAVARLDALVPRSPASSLFRDPTPIFSARQAAPTPSIGLKRETVRDERG